jgi:IS1 family transposase
VSNVLKLETRIRIAAALAEGNSIRGTARQVLADKDSVMSFGLKLGDGCGLLHNRLVRGLATHFIEADETWSFITKKESRLTPNDPAEFGDAYTFVALDAGTKLVISYLVGKRDQPSTDAFIADLRARITVVPQFTTDGLGTYPVAVGQHFPGVIDYAQTIKNYRTGSSRGPDHRYEPARDPFVTKHTVCGAPDEKRMSTAHVERFNLTARHVVGRTRRLCLAFSKTKRGHEAAMSLGICAYNFVRKHGALGDETPAMAAGLTDHPWSMAELVTRALAEVPSAKPLPRALALSSRTTSAARELPNGRGFLRAVGSSGAPSEPGGPGAPSSHLPERGEAATPLPAPVAAVASSSSAAPDVDPRQLSLLDWRPRPIVAAPPPPARRLPPGQLSLLFGIDLEPPKS